MLINIGMHAFYIWQPMKNLPSRQIKNLAHLGELQSILPPNVHVMALTATLTCTQKVLGWSIHPFSPDPLKIPRTCIWYYSLRRFLNLLLLAYAKDP